MSNMVGPRKFPKRTIRKAPLEHRTVLLRADFNVPMSGGKINDDFRIRSILPTIRKLLSYGCKIVIISHLGRPEGKRNLEYSLEPVAQRLAELVDMNVRFVDDCIGPKVKMAIKSAPNRSITVLENLRFHPEEEQNDQQFASSLASDSGASYFVQDGFGIVHRAHASTSAITRYLPSVAGLLLEKEHLYITGAMEQPLRPLVAILGGAKVSDKIKVIEKLVGVADQIVIGGAMANTFLATSGVSMGKSKVEKDQQQVIGKIRDMIDKKVTPAFRDNFLILPTDVAVSKSVDSQAIRRSVKIDKIADDDIALDIGDESIERMVAAIERAQTVIWNGTMGMAEMPEFAHGSARAALALAEARKKTSIVGGGDTADFLINWDSRNGESFSHVSTGGGASLELMAGKKLPGIESLLDA